MKASEMTNAGLAAHMAKWKETGLFAQLPPKAKDVFDEALKRLNADAVREVNAVANEMRNRLVNHGRSHSPTLIAWADRLDAALKGNIHVQD